MKKSLQTSLHFALVFFSFFPTDDGSLGLKNTKWGIPRTLRKVPYIGGSFCNRLGHLFYEFTETVASAAEMAAAGVQCNFSQPSFLLFVAAGLSVAAAAVKCNFFQLLQMNLVAAEVSFVAAEVECNSSLLCSFSLRFNSYESQINLNLFPTFQLLACTVSSSFEHCSITYFT